MWEHGFELPGVVIRGALVRRFLVSLHRHQHVRDRCVGGDAGAMGSDLLNTPAPPIFLGSGPLLWNLPPTDRGTFKSLNPMLFDRNLPSFRSLFHSFNFSKDASKPGRGPPLKLHSAPASDLRPVANTYFSRSSWESSLGESLISWPAHQVLSKILLSSPGRGRGLSSLIENSKPVEKAEDNIVGIVRGGRGEDGGGRASVCGRGILLKKQKKRKILVNPTACSLVTSGSAEGGTIAKKHASGLRDEEALGNPRSSSDIAAVSKPKAARKTRSEQVPGEGVFRGLNENLGVEGSEALGSRSDVGSTSRASSARESSGNSPESLLSNRPNLSGKTVANGSLNEDLDYHQSKSGKWVTLSENLNSFHRSEGGQFKSNHRGLLSPSQSAMVMEQPDGVRQNQTEHSPHPPVPMMCGSVLEKKGARDGGRTDSNVVDESAVALFCTDTSVIDSPVAHSSKFADPGEVYQSLVISGGGRLLTSYDKTRLNNIFSTFSVSGWVSDRALSLYINSKFFPTAVVKFRRFFMHKSSQELRYFVISKGLTNSALEFLFAIFAEFCIHEFPTEIGRYRELVSTADMTKPDAWYPFARAMKRKIVYHKGPTNSGKTYNALQRFMEASSGIYCSPLRLLAMEVFDAVNMKGVYCNLHTGQERKDVPFAGHVACTVEMCYLSRQWEVAVIDEIQMLSDECRGWAWTRAFLGLQADEVHVCGDPSVLPLIENLCKGTGDELVEYEYERFRPLKISEESLRGDFRNIETGDCIVAFSRKDIFDIKREVELASKHRCCVVYGALPPETRTQQAKLFNEADNGYDVLVASDAIGMGLNLNIKRVVFFSLDKFDGDSKKPVPPAQVKQIAGRAGRRGSTYPEGVTTTFFAQDLPYLGNSIVQAFEPATAAGLFPIFEQVELFASQLPHENFGRLLERFSETCRLDGAFFLCRLDNLKRVANMLEKVRGLSLEDRFNFCFAPVNVRDPSSMGALYRYATAFSQKIPVHVEMGVPSNSARDEFELLDLEARHQVLSMYLWLSLHFPGDRFPQKEKAEALASQIAILLGQSLVQSSSRRWCRQSVSPPNKGSSRNSRPFQSSGSPHWKGDD